MLFNFGRDFWGFFSVLFPKAPASCGKKKLKLIFAALYFYLYELKKSAWHF